MGHTSNVLKYVVLFTHSYPYGVGEYFLETEIKYIANKFEHIFIVPMYKYGNIRSTPENVSTITSIAWPTLEWSLKRIIKYTIASLFSLLFYRDLYFRTKTFFDFRAIVRLIGYIGKTKEVHKWIENTINDTELININNSLFYSYWLGPQTLAIGLSKKIHSNLCSITRIHGGDIIEDQHIPAYLPLREITLKSVDQIFAASEYIKTYLDNNFTFKINNCQLSYLGVSDPGFNTSLSSDNCFRIVSCASLFPVKNVKLLVKALREIYLINPRLLIEWNHFGDGPERELIENLSIKYLNNNIEWVLHGQVPNKNIIEFYKNNNIDIFVNTSLSEGLPVSIMEALSCEIPVVAPAVGGIPEIINNSNGFLLKKNYSAKNIGLIIEKIASNKRNLNDKKKGAKEIWRKHFNAKNNYNKFTDLIFTLFHY